MMVVMFVVMILVFDVGGYLTSTPEEREAHNASRQNQIEECIEHEDPFSDCVDMSGR
jgi:hypothetical protein